VVSVPLPPLRERREDIPLLCDYFLSVYSREMQIHNPGMTEEARAFVKGSPWPGNVRELGNAMKKALIFNSGYPIRPEDIIPAISQNEKKPHAVDDQSIETLGRRWIRDMLTSELREDHFNYLMDQFGSLVISEALNLCGGNRSRASKMLGMSRPTLQAKIEKFNLLVETAVRQGDA
jgi:DNA-binding NtrC family response regulator